MSRGNLHDYCGACSGLGAVTAGFRTSRLVIDFRSGWGQSRPSWAYTASGRGDEFGRPVPPWSVSQTLWLNNLSAKPINDFYWTARCCPEQMNQSSFTSTSPVLRFSRLGSTISWDPMHPMENEASDSNSNSNVIFFICSSLNWNCSKQSFW